MTLHPSGRQLGSYQAKYSASFIHVYMKAEHITIHLFFQVGIAGVPADTVMKKTKAIEDNWTPFWDEEFTFPLTVPELALLRIEVHEYDLNKGDDFGGQTCLPVWELRSGIRAVPLHDRKGVKLNHVKLLMRFDFVEAV